MREYTIVRNGSIPRGPLSGHFCGDVTTVDYPYRAEITVRGELRGPDFFIVENSEIDSAIQLWFRGQPSVSCEKMCDEIVDALLSYMRGYDQWHVQSVCVELTGTNGRANLSCKWVDSPVYA